LRYYNIPVYDSLDISCKCIGVLAERGNYLRSYHAKTNFVFNWGRKATGEGRQMIKECIQEGRRNLLETEAKRLLQLHGVPVLSDRLARTADEAVAFAAKIHGKVVIKIVSPDILHKSDAGGVRTGLGNETQVRTAFTEIMKNAVNFNKDADIRGVLVSPMVSSGVEVIIGTKIDDQFGPVIMYGLGGILVEIMKDVSFRVLPISALSAKQMIEETKSFPILKGVRGQHPSDIKAIKTLLLKCSELIESYPEIQEMDLNPVIVHEKGLSLVDARIILKEHTA
jgi:acetyltransferase